MGACDDNDGPADARRSLDVLVEALLASYRSDARGHRINKQHIPSRDQIIEIVELLLQVFYPGYFGRQDLTDENLSYHVGELLSTLRQKLAIEVARCLCFAAENGGAPTVGKETTSCELADRIVADLPRIRALLIDDIQAAFDGDPAASSLDEVILAYPGLLAVTIHRVAHELHRLGVPLMPRIMSEWAHAQTGADIHPGARIGRSFFIDHATGVVIGETSAIGTRVKLYQGVTLGALSHPRDAQGRVIRNAKRHPTVEDGVTIYANATVLGGETVVGEGTLVGGSVFIAKSTPPRSRVAMKPPELHVKEDAPAVDFEI
ncbi:MAG: serine acetyltransferase [Deltaproteobacteria bacterium]|nr:serine acetyltransferase [Deltaproteobacteria bacterium]